MPKGQQMCDSGDAIWPCPANPVEDQFECWCSQGQEDQSAYSQGGT